MSEYDEEQPVGLNRDALAYLHEDENIRIHAPATWHRLKGLINKTTALANYDQADEIIAVDVLNILRASGNFMRRTKDTRYSDFTDELNGYIAAMDHITLSRNGFGRKATMTQIRINQSSGEQVKTGWLRNPFKKR
jgi:hypothetical protein